MHCAEGRVIIIVVIVVVFLVDVDLFVFVGIIDDVDVGCCS